MTNKVYVGDTGTVIDLDTGVSLAGATASSIEVQKPNGTIISWAASVVDTKVRFTSLAGTFDVPGIWRVQAKVTLPSGVWRGETASFHVYSVFN